MASNQPDPEVEEEPAEGYVELECVDSPFSDSSSSSEENDESENDEYDDIDREEGEEGAEGHVPRMGVNPYMFEPVLAEGAQPREEPPAANPANQGRLQVLDWFVFPFSFLSLSFFNFK